MKKPTAVDLFSGCGGLTLGLKQAGFRVIGAVELDRLAAETYKANHRRVVLWESDVRTVAVVKIMRRLKLRPGQVDLVAGCPPCQGFSRMTTLNGHTFKRDARNDLVFELLRFVRRLRPKAVMMENVPRLAKNKRFKRVISELHGMGYQCTSAILDASDYGVPQRRRRLILLAGYRGEIGFGPQSRRKYSVRDALRKLRQSSKPDPLNKFTERRGAKVMQIIKLIPKNGGSRLDLHRKNQLRCHRKCNGFKDVYGRMAWDNVAPTITGGCCNPSKGRFLHPVRNRAITLREAALLQTFPRRYFFSLRRGKFAAAEMIGNALPPEFVRRHASSVFRFVKANYGKDRGPSFRGTNTQTARRR